jgi:hypothetical protein
MNGARLAIVQAGYRLGGSVWLVVDGIITQPDQSLPSGNLR